MNSEFREEVLLAIADRELIEWDAVRRRHSDPESSGWLDAVATVARISGVAREHPARGLSVENPRWLRVLLLAAGIYVAIGIFGRLVLMSSGPLLGLRLATVALFALAAGALLRDSDDVRARFLGCEFLLVSAAFARQGYVTAVDTWLGSGRLSIIVRDGFPLDAFLPYFLWQFVARFPRTTRFAASDRVAHGAARMSLGLAAGLVAVNLIAAATPAVDRTFWWALRTYDQGQHYSMILFVTMLPAFAVMLVRARSAIAHERRRVRLFVLAFVIGSAPALIEVTAEALVPGYADVLRHSARARAAVTTLTVVALLSVPLVTAYAVLVHRLLDVRTTIHHGLQYLLARYTLLTLTLAPFGFFMARVYSHRDLSIAEIVSIEGLSMIVMAASGGVLLMLRNSILTLMDRWFRRGNVGATTGLAAVNEALRQARTPSELADAVSVAAQSVLSCETSLSLLDGQANAYLALGRPGIRLPEHSAIVCVLKETPAGSVLDLEPRSRLRQLLPRSDTDWLSRLGAVLLVPIARSDGGEHPIGLLTFCGRRDALRFSQEDRRFAVALAGAVSIALEKVGLRNDLARQGDALAAACIQCQAVTDSDMTAGCPTCGAALRRVPLPRYVNDKFRLDRVLGAGGMGVVFAATDLLLERTVAVKTLPGVSRAAVLRLRQEARMMAALSHPGLATIHGIEVWRGTPLLVCEYLGGGTLDRRLRQARLSGEEAVALGLRLLDTLDYMHGRNVLHRDLKPSNVGFAAGGTPKLLDFGLARLLEAPSDDRVERGTAAAGATTLAGTIAYMSPEALEGALPNPSFDLWALVVLLFEAVSGEHPFVEGHRTRRNVIQRRIRTVGASDDMLTQGLRGVLTGPAAGYQRSDDIRRVLTESGMPHQADN